MPLLADPEQLIDRIHEAGLVHALWPALLSDLSTAIAGSGASLFAIREGYVGSISSPNIADTVEQFFEQGWAARDPRLARIAALNHAGFVNDNDILTDDEIASNEVYEQFYRKHGTGYMAGTIIPNPSGDSVGFAFQRHQDRGPVPRETVAQLDRLRPHLARSSMIAARLGFERARAQADALQAMGLAAAVIGGKGRVLAANRLFDELVPSVLQDRLSRIAAVDGAADAMLADALATLSSAGGVRSIAVAQTEAHLPMVLHLVPIRGAAHDIFLQASAMFVVTPVDRAAVPSAEVLQGLFDLTPAEARVARSIGQARSIDDIAASQIISRETVRGHLKAVLSKTGLSRQQDLVSLLAGKALPGEIRVNGLADDGV